MMRYEESGDFTTTLHRRLLYILNENLPGSTWYCIAMKMLQYYGDLDMISIEEMASLCAVSKSTISKFIRVLGYEDYRTFQKQAAINLNRKQRENYFVTDVMRYIDEHSTDAYVDAVNEMLYRTDTKGAPWTVVEANNKLFARLKVLETMIQRMEAVL